MTSGAELRFHKLHGAGNDFVLLDLRESAFEIDAARARAIADRRLGVGCDQLLILQPASLPGCAARYEIRNADGSPAGQCGNGVRCIALYLHDQGLPAGQPIRLQGPAGIVEVRRCADGEFEADMGEPDFDPQHVPTRLVPQNGVCTLDSAWGPLRFGVTSMGNPHALIEVADVGTAPLATVGPFLGRHDVFPEGCNVGFAEVRDRGNVHLRVYERGAGETLACGSGACAAVAILRAAGRVDTEVNVFLPGGRLVIKWPQPGKGISMKGPATHVFTGTMRHE